MRKSFRPGNLAALRCYLPSIRTSTVTTSTEFLDDAGAWIDGGEVLDRVQELTRHGDRSANHAATFVSGGDWAASVTAAVGLEQPEPAPLETRRP